MFSFVDQITSITDGGVRGRFAVPEHFKGAPDWLVVEAIGQLAGWAAMRESGFEKRAVGATVGMIEFPGPRLPRGVLELSAAIERTDRRAILYRGEVSAAGALVAVMRRCIGPLLPMEAFEDPESAKMRFASLTGPDPVPLWTANDPEPQAWISELRERGDGVEADFRVDRAAAFFDEHFPRQPVVPASLLIESMCRVGAAAVGRAVTGRAANDVPPFDRVIQVKVRQFTLPGQMLRLEARPVPPEAEVSAYSGADGVASVRVSCAL